MAKLSARRGGVIDETLEVVNETKNIVTVSSDKYSNNMKPRNETAGQEANYIEEWVRHC